MVNDKFCIYCSAYHPMHYSEAITGERHLILECPRGRRHIKYEPGLDIPTVRSKQFHKLEAKKKQMDLL